MKKILIMALAATVAISASAQRHGFGYGYAAPRIIVSTGPFLPYYSPFNSYYSPYGIYPYGVYQRNAYNNSGRQPLKLEQQIKDIINDYNNRIWNVKHASKLKGKMKRHEIRLLKQEKEKAIAEAKINYYKQKH